MVATPKVYLSLLSPLCCLGLLGGGDAGGVLGGSFFLLLLSWLLDMEKNLIDSEEHTNTKLAYEYTESILKDVNKSIDSLNTKMTTVIGFSGVLLRFSADLSNHGYCLYIKIAVCTLLAIDIGLCIIGLMPSPCGDVVSPEDLLDGEWYYKSDERCRHYIASAWKAAIQQLDIQLINKRKCLRYAMWSLALSTILFAVSIIMEAIAKSDLTI
ncbi:hypothetical protein [Anabaena sp. UHCC 0451]|uniref:hypothetical protein n=1 Tax=Anabaena sp. UHCC 0451 TaxID=2055235 RepID=UPI002B213C07|nr:hypothetical protein [Anabaena sp. UHCC 0451]MEA5577659.1 hypothetical protein [Anabaena sp. UHCC 0451]